MSIKRGSSLAIAQVLLGNLIQQRLQAKREVWNINVTQMLVLATMPLCAPASRKPFAGATSTEIATQLGIDRSAVSAQARGLKALGHLELVATQRASDLRERRYELSPSGTRLAEAVRKHLSDVDKLMLGLLGHQELSVVRRLSGKLANGLPGCPDLVRPGTAQAFQADKARERRRVTRKVRIDG